MKIRKISLIGAGNLGTNLALALYRKGFVISEIHDQNQTSSGKLSAKVRAESIPSLTGMSGKSDLYILAVSDNEVKKIAKKLQLGDKLVVHTSGTIPVDILKSVSQNFGVFYPPQTFSKDHPAGFSGVPVCIEANSVSNMKLLEDLALALTNNVIFVNGDQRKMIHLAAVFASNFTNFFYSLAQDLLATEGIDIEILRPIIRKTAENSKYKNIFELQTGPAIREDNDVLKSHLKMLQSHPEYRHIYESISQMIIQKKHERETL